MPLETAMNHRHVRRYITVKEIAAYTLYDASQSMKVGYDDRFHFDVFRINLNYLALASVINGVWDIINDTFIGYLIDRTRTRWGKFRPYLVATRLPLFLVTAFRYLSPLFLPKDVNAISKLFVHLGTHMVLEGLNTFKGIAETGLFAALSPNPEDRVLARSRASMLSPFIDNIPGIVIGLLMDLINQNVLQINLTGLFAWMGGAMALLALVLSLPYPLVAKERLAAARTMPSVREGLTAVLRNKPMRMLLLSDLLGAFKIGVDPVNYFIDVLGYTSLRTLIEVPNIPISFLSYALVPLYRRKFSTRTLWIYTGHLESLTNAALFLFGIVGGTGAGGYFHDWKKMLPAFVLRDTVLKFQWGLRYVINSEVLNEALDYCEWQDGYRAEGMIIASKNLINKLVANSFSWVGATVLKTIGYKVGAGFGQQTERTKFLLFFTCFLLPGITSLLSLAPKLFFNIDKQTRATMYADLADRRKLQADAYAAEDA